MSKSFRGDGNAQVRGASVEGNLYTASSDSDRRRVQDTQRLEDLREYHPADKVRGCGSLVHGSWTCNRRCDCYECSRRKAAAQYGPRVRANLLRMQDPFEVRLSLPMPTACLAEGLAELRACLRKLRDRRAWGAVLAETGMIHLGQPRDGWWNLHVHLFVEVAFPMDQKAVRRAWKAITDPRKRTKWWRKRDSRCAEVNWRAGVVRLPGPIKSADKAAEYIARADQFAPDPEHLDTASFGVMRKALAGKQLEVTRGLNGRGLARRPKQLGLGDRLLSVSLPHRSAQVLRGVLADIRRAVRSSDEGSLLEMICLSAYWPLGGDRWARTAQVLDAAEAQLGCEIMVLDPDTGRCERGGDSLLCSEGHDWETWRSAASPIDPNGQLANCEFVLRNDADPDLLPAHLDVTQVECVEEAIDLMGKIMGRDDDSRGVELACALHRMTEPGTPPRGTRDYDSIVAQKRREILPLLEHALDLVLIAGDPKTRTVVYVGGIERLVVRETAA